MTVKRKNEILLKLLKRQLTIKNCQWTNSEIEELIKEFKNV